MSASEDVANECSETPAISLDVVDDHMSTGYLDPRFLPGFFLDSLSICAKLPSRIAKTIMHQHPSVNDLGQGRGSVLASHPLALLGDPSLLVHKQLRKVHSRAP